MPQTSEQSALIKVKIRGKRFPRVVPKNSNGALPTKGRPLKHASELAPTRRKARLESYRKRKQQRIGVANMKPRTELSTLEALPIELIQLIFLQSLELNLPRASPILAKSLSKESIYRALILLAFFDDDYRHPVEKKFFAPGQYLQLDLTQKLRLQTSILDCRWSTLERLKQAMPVLSHLCIVQAWHEERERELQTDVVEPETEPITPDPALRQVAKLPSLSDTEAVHHHFLAFSVRAVTHEFDRAQPDVYAPRIRTWTSSKEKGGLKYKTVDGARGVFNARCIPDKLLRGRPWTPEKIQHLKFLRQGWRYLQTDYVLKISSEALFEGMDSAITEHNIEALRVLLELHFAAFQDEASHSSVTAAGRTRNIVSFSHPIPVELFHLATRQHDRSSEILNLLLREGIGSISRDDAILMRWAIREVESHDRGATWLLNHMEGTHDYGLNGSSLFVNGRLTWRRSAGDYPFPESTFTSEIGYLSDGALEFRPKLLDA